VFATIERDLDAAERHFKSAIALNPRYPLAHSWYGLSLTRLAPNRFGEAIEHGREALRLDPLAAAMHQNLGIMYRIAGRWEESIRHYTVAAEIEPRWLWPKRGRALAYIAAGAPEQGLQDAKEFAVAPGASLRDSALLGVLYWRTGDTAAALRIRAYLETTAPARNDWIALAYYHAGVGDKDRAFDVLGRGRGTGFQFPGAETNPLFDPMRSDSRWAAFLRTLGTSP
jgi:tetratricopeptide (TPR) repeat protein